jgi:hypothetical protein
MDIKETRVSRVYKDRVSKVSKAFLDHLRGSEIKAFKGDRDRVEFKEVEDQKDRWDYQGLLVQTVDLLEAQDRRDFKESLGFKEQLAQQLLSRELLRRMQIFQEVLQSTMLG